MKSPTFNLFALLLIFSSILGACRSSASFKMAESNKRRETSPTVDDLSALVDGNNAFALDLYHSLHSENGNLVLSPYSISLALAMTYAGARGETEAQMAQALHLPAQSQAHPLFNALDLALETESSKPKKDQEPMRINIANSIWAEQTSNFNAEYLDTLAIHYGAGVRLTDFINQPEPARLSINQWVSDETEDKIKDLLIEGSIKPETRMVLVNAIYFKADWLLQFDANATSDMPFHLLDGTEITTKVMHESMSIPHMQGEGYQAVELKYAGETAAMDIIVPDQGNFEAFESSLNMETLNGILSDMQLADVSLGLPKFKFTTGFGLSDTLTSMGMTDAFDNELADFSGMTSDENLYIGNVIHKAFIAVDEEGTEAAAATAVIMEGATARRSAVNLQIDRPFIFVIRDTVNGQILFIGRVLNPGQ